jgi:hypothetical protein
VKASNWIVRRVMNASMSAFVGSGVSVDDRGRLCMPDGLTPDRIHRFIEMCLDERYDAPRAALHALFARIGVSPRIVRLLNHILEDGGDLDWRAVALHSTALLGSLAEFQQIPVRFRDFLVVDLALADPTCESLDHAVASARCAAAERVACAPTWDAILENGDAVSELARPWRESVAAA